MEVSDRLLECMIKRIWKKAKKMDALSDHKAEAAGGLTKGPVLFSFSRNGRTCTEDFGGAVRVS